MPRQPFPPPELRNGPFLGSVVVQNGLLTPRQLQGACWRRLLRDVYIHDSLVVDTEVRARAAALVLPAGAVVSGRTAAWLHGVDVRGRGELVEVTLPRNAPMFPRAELTIRRALLPNHDIAEVAGIPVTTTLRTGFDLARRKGVSEAVVAVDALTHAGLMELDDLLAYAAEHKGWPGKRQVPQVVDLAEPATESPMESRIRMVIVINGGLPRPEVQVEVCTVAGVVQARIDLGYRNKRVGIEYDGEYHRDNWEADIQRQNVLREMGWSLLRYGSTDVYRRWPRIVRQVEAALDPRRS